MMVSVCLKSKGPLEIRAQKNCFPILTRLQGCGINRRTMEPRSGWIILLQKEQHLELYSTAFPATVLSLTATLHIFQMHLEILIVKQELFPATTSYGRIS